MRSAIIASMAIALLAGLSACGGGGGGGAPVTSPGMPNNGAPPPLPASVKASYGGSIGSDNVFSPNDGDAAGGGNGQSVDGIPCKPTMDEAHYHVHAFIGIVADGSLVSVPDGMGMKNPGNDSGGVTSTASCFYYLHTHDATGILHIEDPSRVARSATLHNFGQFLDIWGQPLSTNGLGPLAGSVKIYTSGPRYRGQGPQTVSSSTYSQYTGDAHRIPLYGHEVIWIEIGPTFVAPQSLPSIVFTY